MNTIDLENVTLRRAGRELLSEINWSVVRGECAAILGPNGAGKSTLLAVIAGFMWPQQGRVRVLGETYGSVDLPRFRARIGYLGASRMPVFHDDMTALEAVLAGMWGGVILPPREEASPEQISQALQALRAVGLGERTEDEMGKLSSGERMRVALARATAAQPELLILDEPTNSLDVGARAAFVHSIESMRAAQKDLTILIVTHHVEDLPRGTDQVLLLREGQVLAAGKTGDTLSSASLSQLFDCVVELSKEDERYSSRAKVKENSSSRKDARVEGSEAESTQ